MLGEFSLSGATPQERENTSYTNRFKCPSGILYCDNKVVRCGDLSILLKGKLTKLYDGEELPINDQEEVVAKYFLEKREKCAELFDGLFFIFIYDHSNSQFYLINNRYLSSSMYYYVDGDRFIFSDRLTEIVRHCIPDPQAHLGSVRSFVSNGFTITDQTQIQGIKKMLPTYRISIENGTIEVTNHWEKEFSFDRKPISNVEEHLDRYEELYQDNIKRFAHYNETQSLGTLLSGGHDTSFSMIHSSKVFDRPIEGFTATFPGWAWNEEKHAENICNKFGGNFHPQPFVASDLDQIVSLIRANEEPVVGSSLPLHMIGKQAAGKVDTILGGDGGDTLWGEYYPVAEYHRYVKHLPLFMRKLCHVAARTLRKITDWERFWELEHVSKLFCEKDYYSGFMRKLCTYRHFSDEFQKELFTPEFYSNAKIPPSSLEIAFTKDNFREALIEGKLFNAFYTYQSFHTYKSMEYYGLKLFFPTIGKEIMQFITELPYYWVNGGNSFHRLTNNKKINRRFHKKALSRHLSTDEIYNCSFDIPWYNILRPRTEVLNRLKKRLIKRAWFNESTLNNLFDEFMDQKVKEHELLELKHHGYRIFTLLSLEIWCTEFLDMRFSDNFEEGLSLEDYLA